MYMLIKINWTGVTCSLEDLQSGMCVCACVRDMFVLVSRYQQRGRLRCVFIEGVRECCTRQSMVSVPYRELFGRWAYVRMMCVCRYTVRAHVYVPMCLCVHCSICLLCAAVYSGVNEVMRRILPLLYDNNIRDGDKPTAYKVDCEVKLVCGSVDCCVL